MPAEGTSLRVLVIDSNRDCADSLAELLRMWGHDVRVAYHPHVGVATAHAYEPHVVLTEIMLPSMDGYELARRLRADERHSTTLLVAITGYVTEASPARALRSGFDSHFVKPMDLDTLGTLLQRAGAVYPGLPRHPRPTAPPSYRHH